MSKTETTTTTADTAASDNAEKTSKEGSAAASAKDAKNADKASGDPASLMETDGGKKLEPNPGAIEGNREEHLDQVPFTHEELEDLASDLKYGETGYLLCDEYGTITGKAIAGVPPKDQPYIPVAKPADTRPLPLATPAGAKIMKRMNPTLPPVDQNYQYNRAGQRVVADGDLSRNELAKNTGK